MNGDWQSDLNKGPRHAAFCKGFAQQLPPLRLRPSRHAGSLPRMRNRPAGKDLKLKLSPYQKSADFRRLGSTTAFTWHGFSTFSTHPVR